MSATSRALTNGAVRVRNAYDWRSRRVAKCVDRYDADKGVWNLSERRDFVWDGWNIVHETVATADGATTNVTEIQYFWGPDLSNSLQGAGGVGGLLAVSRNGSFYFPVYDNNGNVMKYVDESGTIVAAYVYDDFGKIVSQTGSLADAFSFRFSTKYFDQEVDLCAYQRRFYDPDDRFWINRDPIGESGNRGVYTFCLNNSLNYFDVLGNEAFTSTILKFKLQKTLVAIKEVLTQTDSGQDPYGHWWIEFDGESYGWWPSDTVSTTDTFLGGPGKLNGLQAHHDNKIASPTRDAHHGEVPEAMSHPFRKTDGVMKYGKAAKSKCKCVTEDDAKNCVRAFARQYKGKWSWPWGQNCHSFLNEAVA